MDAQNSSKRKFLKSGLALGGLALTGGRALAQGSAVTLRMSSTLPNDPVNSAHAVWYNRFAANLKAAVGDKVVVNYFPSDQLGKEADMVQQVRLGSVDMMISGTSIWATLMPEMGVLDMGYLFSNNDHCGRALDGKAGTILGGMLLERTNVQALGWGFSLGARNVWTKNPVPTAADLKGVKLRVLPVPNFIATIKYMGAVPTPLPFGEIYTALQTGVVDGFEHDAPTALAGKFYEVAKHCALTQHIYNPQLPCISKRSFARIPADLQKPFLDAATEATKYQRGKAAETEAKAFDTLKGMGLTVNTVDRVQLQKQVEKLWGEFSTQYPSVKPVVDEIQATRG
jgi:tripartite ATP-independent transporter DctP family solute receptor